MPDFKKYRRYVITLYRRFSYHLRINDLKIMTSGITNKGIPFVIPENNTIFHGYLPSKSERLFYKLFIRKKIKKVLHNDCIRVAYDIVFRYKSIEKRPHHLNIKESDIVMEVGAFTGYYAMRASEIVGENGKVLAIEAVDENYRILKLNVEKNNLKNIIHLNMATWNEKTTIPFYRHHKQRASALTGVVAELDKFLVKANTVDNILQDNNISKVDFIRIQVNGAELEVLQGMEKTLLKHPRLLIAAIYKSNNASSRYNKIVNILRENNYKCNYSDGSIYAY